ncbi:hypothetical protein J1605_020785 [Eschrichtius robustus]|uniref:NADH dehydrogenase [ubiquinone] iron-sulfur protein 6, mitochondrial n=1 Tax=Eschrichtius robustus TaxID=9764 RepID=A0AB34HJY0_ESCRO|nr:hypothetical protein J1605_020785 [Eschrichtius robustus]
MAAAVTFLRLLGRGGAAARSLPGAARCFGVRTSPTGEKVTHTGQVTPAARRAPSPSGRPGGRSPGSAPVSPGSSAPVPPVPQAQCPWSSRPAPRSLLFLRPSTRVPRSSPSGPRAQYPQSSPPVPLTPQTQRLRSRFRSPAPSGAPGPVYDNKDYRKVRFVGRQKEVSERSSKREGGAEVGLQWSCVTSRPPVPLRRWEYFRYFVVTHMELKADVSCPRAMGARGILKRREVLGPVNENFAIDLIAEQPVSQVESRVISCDGGGGALGHPKVYINLDKETKTGTCGYCGLQFRQPCH